MAHSGSPGGVRGPKTHSRNIEKFESLGLALCSSLLLARFAGGVACVIANVHLEEQREFSQLPGSSIQLR